MGGRTKAFTTELIENRLVVWNSEEGSKLFQMGFYGKPVGIPKPKSADFDAPLNVDLIEGAYLLERKVIRVAQGPEKRRVGIKALLRHARKVYDGFDDKYLVYKDLRDHGKIVLPGIKFGCDYAVYDRGPGIDHAPYMVSVRPRTDSLTATELVRAGRLATTVRKRFIIAVPDQKTGKVQYMIFKWFKA